MEKIPVIIDCDPGHDDMMALVLVYGSGRLDIRAVTTVAGNNTIENTTNNALNVLHYIGADEIPVAMGYQDPIVRSHKAVMKKMAESRKSRMTSEQQKEQAQITGALAHGVSGLDGFVFPSDNPKKVEKIRAVEMMAKVLRESKEKVTLIPTGPLTNVALLIRAFPDLVPKIEKISMMGGTCEFVLTRPYMEFNTFVDPEATKIVFESGVPIDMYGYDVTYKVLCGEKTLRKMEALENQSGKMASTLLRFFMERHNHSLKHLGLKDVTPIHDACAVAGIIDPTLITDARMLHIDVETGGTYFDGATVCDYAQCLNLPTNVNVIYNMDTPRFMEMLVEAASNCL